MIEPDEESKKWVKAFHEWNCSIEGQAGYNIFEKYKREYNFQSHDRQILNVASWLISYNRKQKGKIPNISFLEQELVKFVKEAYILKTEE